MLFSTLEQFIVLGVILVAGFLLGFASRPSSRKWKNKVRHQSDSFTAYHAEAEDRVRAAKQRAAALEAEAAALRADREDDQHTIAALKAAAVAVAPAAPALALVETHPPVEDAAPDAEPLAESDAPAEDIPEQAPVAMSAARPAFGIDPVPVEPIEHVEEPVAAEPVAEFPMTPTPTDEAPAPIGPAEPEMPAKGWFGSSSRDDLTRIRSIDGSLNTRLFGLGVLRFEDLEKLSAEDEMALEERLALPVGYVAREQWRAQAALLRAGNDDEHAERFGAETAAEA